MTEPVRLDEAPPGDTRLLWREVERLHVMVARLHRTIYEDQNGREGGASLLSRVRTTEERLDGYDLRHTETLGWGKQFLVEVFKLLLAAAMGLLLGRSIKL